MNSIHNNGENDKTLHDDLDQLGRAYGQLEQNEPPGLIDQAILNSAHRAVEKKPHWMKFGWLHGLTTTAVFVLAFSLILKQPESTPVYEDSIGDDKVVLPQAEQLSRKPTMDLQAVDSNTEKRKKANQRQDQPKNMAAAVPAEIEEKEAVPIDRIIQPALKSAPASYATRILRKESQATGKDADQVELPQELRLSDETDLMLESAGEEVLIEAATVADAPEPVTGKLEARVTLEQQLQTIIELKAAGDETWITELATFKKQYPHYPVPEELTN